MHLIPGEPVASDAVRRSEESQKGGFHMVAPRQIRRVVCTIVRVSENPVNPSTARLADFSNPARRPSELLPWADPYIAGLVTQLQREVRREQATGGVRRLSVERSAGWENANPRCDLEPPLPAFDDDGDDLTDAWRTFRTDLTEDSQ
ncbi:MAG: hypothetical protein KDA61_16815 [Planctomycetales bacterium]|nr:hypothetical protein [Planctomycetales bacterium]